ncbi:carboxypeptidase regulatory-like domain-containing protein [Bacteroidota bacterium]
MKNILLYLLLLLNISALPAQDYTQTIRGTIKDRFSEETLPSATVFLSQKGDSLFTTSDASGNFSFDNVNVGRISLKVNFIGYKSYVVENLILSTGKELVLEIFMVEDPVALDDIIVRAKKQGEVNNKMAYISTRSFNVEETERYAGSNGDPARMASYFAGVQAAGESRNDIIIRGNSPLGLLWMLEGVPIPNPNHFASMGTNGGAMSILNNNQLANSDFFTGAFPANYGNATAGAFDLNMRKGNNEKYEFTLQMGTGGLETGVEGPLSKSGKSSFMFNYRYAFLELFDKIGIKFDIPVIPKYQDFTFKTDFLYKKTSIALWGMGGNSTMTMEPETNDLNFTKDLKTTFGSQTGVYGLTVKNILSNRSFIHTTLAYSNYKSYLSADSVYSDLSEKPFFGGDYTENKLIASSKYKLKMNASNHLVVGARYIQSFVDFADSARSSNTYLYVTNNKGDYGLWQAYAQYEHQFSRRLQLSIGLFNQGLILNNSISLEPRLGIKYEPNEQNSISFGYGLHSQTQPGNVYFNQSLTDGQNETYELTNKNLDFSKSHHFVLGHILKLNNNINIKSEAYYQYLYNIPIEQRPSHYSVINYGADFYEVIRDSLINNGQGKNMGIELTIEKYFSSNYYFMLTGSLFDSKYKASDNIWRNTVYNSNYILNALGGYEIHLPKHQTLAINANIAYAGGLRYIPIDVPGSIAANETVYDFSKAYNFRNTDFFKANLKLIYRVNLKKFSYETAFEITNITNRKNIFKQSFNPETGTVENDNQMGLMPGGMVRLYF